MMPVISFVSYIDQDINARSKYTVLNSMIRDTKVRRHFPAWRLVHLKIWWLFRLLDEQNTI